MPNPQRSIPAAITLFFLAPLVAEFLLGDFPVTWLALVIVLAPMYGGGALLIRELTRRSGRGWPTILLLGVAYAIIEEAFTTQTLFNPDIYGLHAHLLSHAWIPSLGIGAWWTLFMLNVHPFWSIGVSIALAEGLFPSPDGLYPPPAGPYQSSARTPWLGKVGLYVAAALFAIGIVYNTWYTFHHDPFRASHTQFIVAALLVVVFAIAAFLLPPSATLPASISTHKILAAPSPWITGSAAFLLGAAVFLTPILWNWGAVALILAVDLVFLLSLWMFSRLSSWTALHTFSIGAAGALVYTVHAFISRPIVHAPKGIVLASHVLFLLLALAVIAVAARRTKAALAASSSLSVPASA
jgi:hypothetical protein